MDAAPKDFELFFFFDLNGKFSVDCTFFIEFIFLFFFFGLHSVFVSGLLIRCFVLEDPCRFLLFRFDANVRLMDTAFCCCGIFSFFVGVSSIFEGRNGSSSISSNFRLRVDIIEGSLCQFGKVNQIEFTELLIMASTGSTLDLTSASKAATNNALNEAPELKQWLKHKGIWLKDLFEVLVSYQVHSPDDFFLILDETLDEIKRKVRVLRASELKSNDAKMRMEKILQKFEDEWRKLEGKSKNKKQEYDEKDEPPTPTQTSKEAAFEELRQKGKHLKEWMRSQGIWQLALYEELINAGITHPEQLGSLKQKQFDNVVRKVRVDRFSQLKDQKSRKAADKLLVKFEKLYKKQKK